MPDLKTRTIFISHAWSYNEHYWKLVKWFNEEPNFSWKNCSVPSHDALPDKTFKGLSAGMTRQISLAQIVVVFAGMYSAHSAWIDYEISEAQRMMKTIIGVAPWDQQRIPINIQNASICPVVRWNRASVIQAIRQYT